MADPRIYFVPPIEKRRAERGEATRYLHEVVLGFTGDDCLIWPFGRKPNGYAYMGGPNRTTIYVHREVCRRVHGEPHGDRTNAAHECGHGHLGCVNPNHLSWKTQKENMADTLVHGTRARGEKQGQAKLTEEDARKIKRDRASTQQQLASRFSVSQSTIFLIKHGINWAWVV